MTYEVKIALPERSLFKNIGGKAHYVDWQEVPANVLGEILVGGAMIILNNAFNSVSKDDKANEDMRLARALKRLDAWKQGSYTIVERGDGQASLMKECYVAEVQERNPGASLKSIEAAIKRTVKETLGEVNATFDNFLHAVAVQKASADGETRSADELRKALVERYEDAAAKLAASRAKAGAALADIDLDIDI